MRSPLFVHTRCISQGSANLHSYQCVLGVTWGTVYIPQSPLSLLFAVCNSFSCHQKDLPAVLLLSQARREDLCVSFKNKQLDVPAVACSLILTMACSRGLLAAEILYSSCVVGWFFLKYALPNVVAFSFSSIISLKLTHTKGKHPGIKLYRVQIPAFPLSFPVGMLGKVDLVSLSAPIFGISIQEKYCAAASLSFVSHPCKSIGAVAWICASDQWCINASYASRWALLFPEGHVGMNCGGEAPGSSIISPSQSWQGCVPRDSICGWVWRRMSIGQLPCCKCKKCQKRKNLRDVMCLETCRVFLPESVWQWTAAQVPVSTENSSLGPLEAEGAFQYVSLGLGVQEFMDFSPASTSLAGLHVQSSLHTTSAVSRHGSLAAKSRFLLQVLIIKSQNGLGWKGP